MAAGTHSTSTPMMQFLDQLPVRIDEVELFRLDAAPPPHLSFNPGDNRQHAALRLCADGLCGWSEGLVAHNDPSFELAPWGACFSELKGKTVAEALTYQHQHRESWWVNQLEMSEMALLDLAGRLLDKPVMDLLGLDGRQPVPGLYSIVASDAQHAAEQAALAKKQNLTTHIKLRIYGEPALDAALVRAVRKVMGPETYLIAGASESYTYPVDESVEALAAQLRALHQAGLNACEDPANLAVADWVDLQTRVGMLALIPDKPMRPAWHALQTVLPGMGRVYNLHPGSLGSLVDAVALARKIQSFGAQVAVGDDSLMGPGCTAWQQIAVGLGAAWVEALAKPQESNVFGQCVQSQATVQKSDGRLGLVYDYATRKLPPGFGLQVDVPRLRKVCSAYCSI